RPDDLGTKLRNIAGQGLRLQSIFNRGTIVWPNGFPETFCTDHWRARFVAPKDSSLSQRDVIGLLIKVSEAGFDVIKTENLYTFDGKPGFSTPQLET
ncbi:MAG: NADP-dependent isocitrate dehydrogenase, partial [Candidatus Eremiobacteraeota bacterium]|nr:NADP-dependent isocitrate dehydrogenase [Candidatus Eremiobacteraeota bacterium]